MGGGVVVAAAAARRRHMRDVLDAYRVAGATSVERAKVPAELGLGDARGVNDLRRVGALLDGERPGSMYLSESGWIAYRDARPARALRVLLVLLVAGGVVGLYALYAATNSPR